MGNYLQEPGRYLAGIPLVVADAQVHDVITLPPSVVPTSAAVPMDGERVMAFAVKVVAPPKAPALPVAVMMPLASTLPDATYFVTEKLQAAGSVVETSAFWAVCTISVTVVRQDDAARITSDTLARTV